MLPAHDDDDIKLAGLFNTKIILVEERQWNYLTHDWMEIKGFNPFLMGISPKVNVIARPEFELATQH